jgi:hypothetical protein
VALRRGDPEAVDAEVAALEAAALPRAEALEAYRGRVAAALDAAARALEKAGEPEA